MARIGKIARVPEGIREELNRRLRGGELGPQLLPWLNGLPEVQGVLSEFFAAAPINAQNLSDWRQGGFAEWEEKQDKTYRIRELAGFASRLAEANGGTIAEGAAAIAGGKILELLEAADQPGSMDAAQLGDLVRSIAGLRAGDAALERAAIDREKLKQKDEEIALAKAQFDQRLTEYQNKVAEQKRVIEGALSTARAGGLTAETLEKIEQAARLL